jgi:progesterone-induced-blocking factor 1
LEKNKRLDDRVDKLETELIEAKNQAQSYLFKLLDHKTETIADYEKRVNKEINELREKQ